MKVCQNIRYFPKTLKRFLEKETRGSLKKIRLIFPNQEWPVNEKPPFYRFRLEGIPDINLGYLKVGTKFKAIAPLLFEAYPDSLLRVGKEIGWTDLILDFKSESGIFKDFSSEGFQKALDWSPEELYRRQRSVEILDILPPKKVLRRIRKKGDPN